MNGEIEHFDTEGLYHLTRLLGNVDPELHPIYISFLIESLGRNKCQLPTRDNEMALLKTIQLELPQHLSPQTSNRVNKILGITRKKRMRETAICLVLGYDPFQNQATQYIQVYADEKFVRLIEKARQGYIQAIQDIETHIPGEKTKRVHEEEQGRVLCQADTNRNQWGSADRFVYGTDSSQMTKALGIAHVVDHQDKGSQDYINQKNIAKKTTDADFQGKHLLSSKHIQQMKNVADQMIPPSKTNSRINQIRQEYDTFVESFGKEGAGLLKDILSDSIRIDGPLTKSDKKIILRMPKKDPFRVDIEKAIAEIEQENASNTPSSAASPNGQTLRVSTKNDRE